MSGAAKRLWLVVRKLRFLLLPVERRVRLEVGVDGRHLTYLLTALGEAGYGVHVAKGEMVFRELVALRKSVRIPFIVGGKERGCGISISDREVGSFQSSVHSGRKIVLDYDYFSGLTAEGTERAESESAIPATPPEAALRMPYFLHPSVYHRGLHKIEAARHSLPVTSHPPQRPRRFRIGFFGTHDREFYTRHYHFPGMNRFEIIELLRAKFGQEMTEVSGAPDAWPDASMVVTIDSKGGDRAGKTFLAQNDYFSALRQCDFVLSPPGWCMPLSHNLIEAMMCGAIPITNAAGFMAPPLESGLTCLAFDDAASFEDILNRALDMPPEEVTRMRRAVMEYYDKFLEPSSFGRALASRREDVLLVNAEERSVPFAFDCGALVN